ncbi:IS110 family transposase [Gordonia sp. (in: high G+C Gram-positive bacteria)]|uniref:IS110 family transposase n=1 Tax=Gordonia sp. (in: high G+C Gram-positive bacteria) TaxID=84139 RepID=UPI00391B0173
MTSPRPVVAGADTHSETHHVAVLDAATGAVLADRQFPATTTGYHAILTFIATLGQLMRFGVEGTNSYGAGLTRHLLAAGIDVREVIRPNRAARRLRGKSDPLDAITAARAVLADEDLPLPKTSDGPVESIRVLTLVRDSAVKARAKVLQQIAMILVSAPAGKREQLQSLDQKTLLTTLRRSRQGDPVDGIEPATTAALRRLARRHEYLSEEIDETTDQLRALVEHVNPGLLATKGIGVVTAAQLLITVGDNPERITGKAAFAALTGVSPIPASSGKTNRHRLNRGGDRRANNAIHTIALVRMSADPRTKIYITKKLAEGKTKLEAIRCLKRHIANEIYTLITNPPAVPDITDLRPARLVRGLSLQNVADHFGVWPMHISTIERGKRRDDELANRYRQWLTTA